MVVYGRQRLRGTAALQVSCDHRCHQLVAIAGRSAGGRPLRRRRVSEGGLRPATAARDRRPPSLLRSSLPSADGHSWPICWRASAPSAPCKRGWFTAGNGCEGPPPSKSPAIIVAIS